MDDFPPHKRRLTIIPSDSESNNSTPRNSQQPNQATVNPSPNSSHVFPSQEQENSYPPWATVTNLPTSSTDVHPGPSTTPLSIMRHRSSFYSCRDTPSPAPPKEDDDADASIYSCDERHSEDRGSITPTPLQPRAQDRKRSASFQDSDVFAPLGFSIGGPDESIFGPKTASNLLGDTEIPPEKRGADLDDKPVGSSGRAKEYESLVEEVVNDRRRAAAWTEPTAGFTAAAAAAAEVVGRRKESEADEREMREKQQKKISDTSTATAVSSSSGPRVINKDEDKEKMGFDVTGPTGAIPEERRDGPSAPSMGEVNYKTWKTLFMGIIVSMGGLIFGYGGIGQIGGFLLMPDYANRFGNKMDIDGTMGFSDDRAGTIVGMLMIGALVGAFVAAPTTDRFGRKYCIALWALVFAVGQVIEISTQKAWYQIVIGRTIEGLGIGGLSILTPLYMGEVAPNQIRGVMIRYVRRQIGGTGVPKLTDSR